MMDLSRFLDTPNAGQQTNIMAERLKINLTYLCMLIMLLDERCPDVVERKYLQNVLQKTKYAYLNNTVAYVFAYAMKKLKELHLYGIDFTHKAVNFAEAGRACCEFWLAIARKGIKINIMHIILVY